MTMSLKGMEEEMYDQLNLKYGNNIPRHMVKFFCGVFLEIIEKSLVNKQKVRLENIGVLDPVIRKPRMGRNPKTGEIIPVKEKIAIKFRCNGNLYKNLNLEST